MRPRRCASSGKGRGAWNSRGAHTPRGEIQSDATAIDDALLAQFRAERVNGHIELSVDDLHQLNALVDQIRARGGLVSELSPLRSTLEDVFVDLVRAQP